MGWIKQTAPPCDHPDRPTLPTRLTPKNRYMLGDVWECDNCNLQFQVTESTYTTGDQRESYKVTVFEWSAPRPNPLSGYLDR